MTDFSKILDKAKELEAKMKESQQKIKEIKVEGSFRFKFCKDNFGWRGRDANNKVI